MQSVLRWKEEQEYGRNIELRRKWCKNEQYTKITLKNGTKIRRSDENLAKTAQKQMVWWRSRGKAVQKAGGSMKTTRKSSSKSRRVDEDRAEKRYKNRVMRWIYAEDRWRNQGMIWKLRRKRCQRWSMKENLRRIECQKYIIKHEWTAFTQKEVPKWSELLDLRRKRCQNLWQNDAVPFSAEFAKVLHFV